MLYTISDFGAVSIVRYNTLTLAIYIAYRSLFDRTVAASVSTVLVFLALAFIAVQPLLQRRTRPVRSGPQSPPAAVPLGRWQWPCQAGLLLLSLLTLGTTTGVLAHWGIRAIVQGNALGSAWEAAINSLGVSLMAALVAALSIPRVACRRACEPGRLCASGDGERLRVRVSSAEGGSPGGRVRLRLRNRALRLFRDGKEIPAEGGRGPGSAAGG